MRCPSCQTFVTKIPVNWKCPFCGERLPDPSRWYNFHTYMTDYLQDKGVIFWTVWFGILVLFIGAVELLFGSSFLISYVSEGLLTSLVSFFYAGMLIDMVVMINLPLRLQTGTDFIVNERKVIRNIRKLTNLSLLVGVIFTFIWLGPRNFLVAFPAYPLVVSWFLVLGWSIMALFLDPRMSEDIRFRAYMERLGVLSLKRYRRLGTACIGVLVAAAIGFNVLVNVSGLWIKFSNLWVIGVVLRFTKEYFSWMF